MSTTHEAGRTRGGVRRGRKALAVVALLLSTSAVHAVPMPEEICQSKRVLAAGKYASCVLKALARFNLGQVDYARHSVLAGKCASKYATTWATLQARAIGTNSTCDNPRFVDNGDGTVTDRLTALRWEMKTDLDGSANFGDPHDADNDYSWSAGGAGFTTPDGTAFTGFLASLNGGGCFAGACDWRLPTRDELLTIAAPVYPSCTAGPCIDPVLGPTLPGVYWSATTLVPTSLSGNNPAQDLNFAWFVAFSNGLVQFSQKGNVHYARAVRGGL